MRKVNRRLVIPSVGLGLASFGVAQPQPQRSLFQDDLWREFELYRDRLLQLAKAIPEDKFNWSPGTGVRSTKEVLLHVSLNNYMLLERMGLRAPEDLFPALPESAQQRPRAVFAKTLEYEKSITGKAKVLEAAERAFAAAAKAIKESSAADLEKTVMWGDRKWTVFGLQLRIVAHLHEHLGQLIAYARTSGVKPPWSE